MEATGYAFGAADLCAAGVGAPHIRQRLFFGATRLADAGCDSARSQLGDRAETQGVSQAECKPEQRADVSDGRSAGGDGRGVHGGNGVDASGLADASGAGQQAERAGSIRDGQQLEAVIPGSADGLGNADNAGSQGHGQSGNVNAPSDGATAGRHGATTGVDGGLADAADAGLSVGRGGSGVEPGSVEQSERLLADGGLADADGRDASAEREQRGGEQRQQPEDGGVGGLADAGDDGSQGRLRGWPDAGREALDGSAGCDRADCWPSPTNGHWRDADWLFCRGPEDDGLRCRVRRGL